MESGNGRFKSQRQVGIPVDATYGFYQFRPQKRVTRNIDTVAGRKQNVVNAPLRSVIQIHRQSIRGRLHRDDGSSDSYFYRRQSWFEPGGAARPNTAMREPWPPRSRNALEPFRPR